MKKHHRKKGFLIFLAAVLFLSGLAMPAAPAEAAAKARTAAKTKVAVTLKAGSKKVNGKTVTLKAGGSKKITLSVKPKKKGLKVAWRSGKKSVVSVSSTGKLKAKKAGTAKITATVSGKKIKTAKAWLLVKVPAEKEKVAVTLKTGSRKVNGKTVTLKKGGSQKITLSVKPKKKGLKVAWRSGKKSVVSVSSAGKLKAKKAGTAKITATVSGKKIKTVQAWLKVKVDGRSDSGKKEDGTARPQEPAKLEKPQEPAKPEKPQEPAKPTEPEHTCIISIDCITLAENLSLLRDPKQASLVPKDGWMLKDASVEFTPGDTAYDVLAAVCQKAGYPVEASYTQSYGSYYVEGINGLYEFDAGPTSGWMYSVNGVYPPHASSAHTVSDGDVICWRYTLDLGKDIGGSNTVGQ